MVNHKCFLGYDKDAEGRLVVNRAQAKVVKRIFQEYLEGYTMNQIAAGLSRDGVLTGTGRSQWSVSTIRGILANEKYTGDALLQKTVTVDILSKKRIKNDGREPQYYIEDNHEAIVSREVFDMVQAERKRRWELVRQGTMHKGKYALSGICKCAGCGSVLKRVTWYKPRKMAVWRCSGRIAHGKDFCAEKAVQEKYIHGAITEALDGNGKYDDLQTRRLVKCVLVGVDGIVVELKDEMAEL